MKGNLVDEGSGLVSRISVSLPPDVRVELDELVARRGFENRSQAVASMIRESALEARGELGDTIMAGTITLFYSQKKGTLLAELAEVKRRSIDEVIGSLQVQLERDDIMEVILVQGPACQLKRITDDLVSRKGVKAGKLTLTSAIMPPIHPLGGGDGEEAGRDDRFGEKGAPTKTRRHDRRNAKRNWVKSTGRLEGAE